MTFPKLPLALAAIVGLGLLSLMPGAYAGDEPRAVMPFNGQNLHGWRLKPHPKNTSHWVPGAPVLDPNDPRELRVDLEAREALINAKGHGVDIFTEYEFGDAVIELDVMVPKGSNSGIYVHGDYEVQVLDSFGVTKPGPGDMGAIYGAAPPSDPLYKAPGEWQHYQIVFRAPRFNDRGEKLANARFEKIVLNGRVIHKDVELKGPTPGGVDGKESEKGPLMFQGDHGPVAYRHIVIKPL